MKNVLLLLVLGLLHALGLPSAYAQLGGEALPDLSAVAAAITPADAPPASGGLFRSGLAVPSVDPGATARSIGRQLREQVEAETGPTGALDQLEALMPMLLSGIEQDLESAGFALRDFGTAAGYAFIYNWETATRHTIPVRPSEAAARTVARTIAEHWEPRYRTMDPAAQEEAYEALLMSAMLLSTFAQQLEQNGADETAADMRQTAGETFRALFGVSPDEVSIDAEGRISGLASEHLAARSPSEEKRLEEAGRAQKSPPPSAASTRPAATAPGNLAPASITDGTEVYVKYTWSYGTSLITYQDPLVLFPDGMAFDEMPSTPVVSFDPASLQAAFSTEERQEHVGTWTRADNVLALTFDGETRRLPRVARGWWDDDDAPDSDAAYDTYFPIIPATTEDLLGPWVSEELTTIAMIGGDAPMVTSRSTTNRVFYADGTFSEDREAFASATNAGGTADEGSFGVFGTNESHVAGRWRSTDRC